MGHLNRLVSAEEQALLITSPLAPGYPQSQLRKLAAPSRSSALRRSAPASHSFRQMALRVPTGHPGWSQYLTYKKITNQRDLLSTHALRLKIRTMMPLLWAAAIWLCSKASCVSLNVAFRTLPN